jgi:hypothetical protein
MANSAPVIDAGVSRQVLNWIWVRNGAGDNRRIIACVQEAATAKTKSHLNVSIVEANDR